MARKRPRKKKTPDSPITPEGGLNWNRVQIPAVASARDQKTLPGATLADQEVPVLAGSLIVMCFFGIVFTTRWAPLLLAVLVLASLIDRRMRENNWMLLQALLASALCLACWPLITQIVVSANASLTVIAVVTLVAFICALWFTGNITRAASLLHEQLLLRSGLYAVGVACQSLALLVLLLGVWQLGMYIFSL